MPPRRKKKENGVQKVDLPTMSSKTLAGSAYFYEVHILIQNLGKINHIHQHIMNF